MDLSAVAAFWLVAVLLIVAPGPDWAFTLGAAQRGSAVLPAVTGLVTGYAVMTGVVAAGIGAVVAGTPAVLAGITLVGGVYLVWLGVSTLRRPPGPLPDAGGVRPDRRTYVEGIGVSGLNPKGLLIFVGLLPQFTDPRAPWPVCVQMMLLGAVFTLTCAAFYLALGSFARTVLHAQPAAARAVSRLAGVGMVVIGAWLLADRVVA